MKLEDAINYAANSLPAYCFLCSSRNMAYVGVFIPDDPRLWLGGPVLSGKTRALFYRLCALCMERPDVTVAIEEKLRADAALMAVEGLPQ